MRTYIGIVLMLLTIPYAIWGATHGNNPSVYMGVVALIVTGGLLIARGRNSARSARQPALMAVPDPWRPPAPTEPGVSAETASQPGPPPLAEPPDMDANEGLTDRHATMLPPPPGPTIRERPHLRLVHTDGVRLTPEQLRRKAK